MIADRHGNQRPRVGIALLVLVQGLQTRSPDTSKQLATVEKECSVDGDELDTEKQLLPLEKPAQGLGLGWLIGSHFYLLA